MPTKIDAYTTYDRGWIVRIRPPQQSPAGRAALLIHGWTGNETVMWVFARALPLNSWLFAPRGLVASPGGGYGWLTLRQASLPRYDHYLPVAAQLMTQLDHWIKNNAISFTAIDIIGFSQGAALAYAILAGFPERVNRLAAIAGYLPSGIVPHLDPIILDGKKLFIAHGAHDDTIPVGLAQQAAKDLETARADVTYCEDSVGHKIGTNCMKALERFFAS